MISSILPLFESYLNALVHPYKTHDYMKFNIPIWDGEVNFPKLNLPEALTLSWIFWIIGSLVQMVILNSVLSLLLSYQNENDILYLLIDTSDALFPYYISLLSLLLDLIFFPIMTLIQVEVMNAIIRFYARLMGHDEDTHQIADQISTVALSSNFFSFIPLFGKMLVQFSYLFLMYVGLRHNLGASRSLSIVILLTPLFILIATLMLFVLSVFYLFSI